MACRRPVRLLSASSGLSYFCNVLTYHGTIRLSGIDTREHTDTIRFATDQTEVFRNRELHDSIVGN